MLQNLIDSSHLDLSKTMLEPWQSEYVRGRNYSIYACNLPKK